MIDPHAFPSASQPLPAATPHHPPQTRLTPRLIAPVALAFAALLATVPSTRAAQIDIPGPAGSGTFGKTVTYLPNGNFVVTDPTYSLTTPTAVASVGAVHLYNGSTLALISTLTGSTASDQIGNGGLLALNNGNYVVSSGNWDNGAVTDAGAVTWGNGAGGTVGAVSATNSLVGSTASDGVGGFMGGGVIALTNSNYVVAGTTWDNGALANAGAVALCSGTDKTTGTVSASNSILGTVASGGSGLVFSYDSNANKLLVGQPSAHQVSFFGTIVVYTHQELWRFTNFGSYDFVASADPDGDGLNNLLEYALGTGPNSSGVMPAVLALNGANLEYTYTRSTAAKDNGVTYQIEWSDTLEAGSWSTQTVTEQIQGTEGALETVKASVPAGFGSKRFLRLRVGGATQDG